MVASRGARTQFIVILGLVTLVCVGLFAGRAYRHHDLSYGFLLWNLFLAWVPFGLSLWLVRTLNRKLWSSWEALITSILWLVFLPNSFYMISDYIHLQDVATVDALYDSVMITAFVFMGLVLGFSSLYFIQRQFLKRVSLSLSFEFAGAILFICSFAIYVGRDLRWNSWDILANPAGLIFDVSDRFLHLSNYPQLVLTTFSFFVLLSCMYAIGWQALRLLSSDESKLLY